MRLNWRHVLIAVFGLLLVWHSLNAAPLDSASLEFGRYLPNSRVLEIPGHSPSYSIGLNLGISPGGPFYWTNRVHASTVGDHFRWVGWQYEMGARFERFDLFYGHHSQHAMDGVHPLLQPTANLIGLRIRLYP